MFMAASLERVVLYRMLLRGGPRRAGSNARSAAARNFDQAISAGLIGAEGAIRHLVIDREAESAVAEPPYAPLAEH
jgi:hypothetical protein